MFVFEVIRGREASVCNKASEIGVELEYPTRTILKRKKRTIGRARRPVISTVPVVRGYLFGAIDDKDVAKVKAIDGVFSHHIEITHEREIADIQDFLRRARRGDFDLEGPLSDVKPGEFVRMRAGPLAETDVEFAGISGSVAKVFLKMFGGKVLTKVNVDDVDRIE